MASISAEGTKGHHTYTLTLTIASQSIQNNTSTINYSFDLADVSNWFWEQWGNYITYSITANGKEIASGSIPNHTTKNQTITSGTFTVPHNADGSKTIDYGFTVTDNANQRYTSGNASASSTMKLTAIPRQATLTGAPNFNDEENPAITYSNPAGNAVSSLKVCIANYAMDSTYANWRDVSKTGTSYTFNLTDTERNALRNATINSNTLTVKFMIETVINGVNYYNNVSKTLTIINGSPILNPIVKDIGDGSVSLTGDENKIIKGFNHIEYTSNVTALKGATITSQKVVCGSQVSTNGNGSFINVDSASFVFTVTDSRGNTTSQTINKTLIDYIKVSNNIKNNKPDVDGKVMVACDGNYFNGSFGAVNNTLLVQYRYKEQYGEYSNWTNMTATINGNTYAAEANLTGLDYRKTYVFQTKVTDAIFWEGILSQEIAVRSYPVFDWGEEDFNINGELKINNKSIFDLIYPIGAIYMSLDNTNPTYLFGGEWENIQGRFLIAAGTSTDDANITKTFNVGQTGGEYDHQLTIQEMPRHNHDLPIDYGNHTGTIRGITSWSDTAIHEANNVYSSWYAGGDWTHNNTPPYLAVYMWKRIA